MRKTVKVVMLPTENKSQIQKSNTTHRLFYDIDVTNDKTYQHLYLISDEEIKEGDWYYDVIEKEIFQRTLPEDDQYTHDKKIIATTDKSLTECCKGVHRIGEGCNLNNSCNFPDCRPAKIPQSFIEAYVKAEGKIDEVQVEYNEKYYYNVDELRDRSRRGLQLKYFKPEFIKTREDNTVIISKSKDNMYTKELFLEFKSLADAIINPASDILPDTYSEEYIAYYAWVLKHL
jgi:hypothetical protein